MSWTETARRDHARRGLRYSSDLTDREWALISPFLPEPRPLGHPRTTDLREVVNAILYLASRLRVVAAAQGLPALHDRPALLLRLARPWGPEDDQPSSRHGGA